MAGGKRLAELALLLAQAGLGRALGAERLFLGDDDGGLPDVALFGLLLAVGGEVCPRLLGLDAAVLRDDGGQQQGNQGGGDQPEAQRGHAACSCPSANSA